MQPCVQPLYIFIPLLLERIPFASTKCICTLLILQIGIYRFVPSSLKLFFNAFSVGKIDPIKNTSCITMIIILKIPIVSSLAHKKGICINIVGPNRPIPTFHQSFPAWSCANLQISIFIIDILVRYPTTPLIFFGQCFHIILPAIIIIAGIIQSHIKINHQNHILPLTNDHFTIIASKINFILQKFRLML